MTQEELYTAHKDRFDALTMSNEDLEESEFSFLEEGYSINQNEKMEQLINGKERLLFREFSDGTFRVRFTPVYTYTRNDLQNVNKAYDCIKVNKTYYHD